MREIKGRLNSIMELKNQLETGSLDNEELYALLIQLKAQVGLLAYYLGV